MNVALHATAAALAFTIGASLHHFQPCNYGQNATESPKIALAQIRPVQAATQPRPQAQKQSTPSPYRTPIEWTVHQLESSGKLGPISHDNGAGLGPLAIHRAAWQDAQEHLGTPERPYHLAADLAESLRAHRGYVDRYGAKTPAEIFALWNAGPRHARKTGQAAKNRNRYVARGLDILRNAPR